MFTSKRSQRPSRNALAFALTILTAGALAVTGCGGGDKSETSEGTNKPNREVTSERDQADNGDSEETNSGDVPDPVVILPMTSTVPNGYRETAARCEVESGDVEPDVEFEDEYAVNLRFAVPEGWKNAGRSSGGSGSLTGTSEARRFQPGDSTSEAVEIAYDWDNRSPEGEVMDSRGNPWKTFDYETSLGDDKRTITYEKVGTVEVGDQKADLYHLDQSQAPDHVSQSEYKVRLETFEIPSQRAGAEYRLTPYSMVVTIRFDSEKIDLDEETVEKIIRSFSLPECSWKDHLRHEEIVVGVDLDGDGHVTTVEEMTKEIREKAQKAIEENSNKDD